MAIITRPIKLGGGTDYVAGNDELAQEFNDDINTVYNDYNGNITNVNCSPIMALEGSKLADAPSGVSTAKINDGAINTVKLADNSVTTAKIIDLNVTTIKIAALAILLGKIKTGFVDWTPVGTLAAGAEITAAGVLVATGEPIRLEARQAGTPSAGLPSLNMSIFLNTASSQYYFLLVNTGAGVYNFGTNPVTFRMIHIMVA